MGRNARYCACATFALGLISGCATYEARPISAAHNAAALEERSLEEPQLRELIDASRALTGEPVQERVWDLDTLTLAALYFHPELDLARARLAAAQAGAVTARQMPNPSLDVALTRNATTTTPSPWTVGYMVAFIIETFGKREYRTAQAEHLIEAARADMASATWLVRRKVRDGLVELWLADERRRLSAERLERQEHLVRLIERRFSLGEASAVEVTRERINRNQAALAARDSERQGAAARSQLAQAVGVPVHALQSIPISFDAVASSFAIAANLSKGELRAAALASRSDVQGLLAEYAAAEAALQLQIARQYPDLKIGPGYAYDQGDHKYELALGAGLPLFNRNEGPIAEAQARRLGVAARLNALQAQIIGAIDGAAANYRASADALATADALLEESRRREAGIARRFAAGDIDRPALLGVQIEVANARISRLDALGGQRRAIGELEDALRTPLYGHKAKLPVMEQNPRLASEARR